MGLAMLLYKYIKSYFNILKGIINNKNKLIINKF